MLEQVDEACAAEDVPDNADIVGLLLPSLLLVFVPVLLPHFGCVGFPFMKFQGLKGVVVKPNTLAQCFTPGLPNFVFSSTSLFDLS